MNLGLTFCSTPVIQLSLHLLKNQNYQPNTFFDDETDPTRDDDYRRSSVKPRHNTKRSGSSELFKNRRQIGAGLVGVGLILTFLGMMLFFEGNLLRLGNMATIIGVPLLVGPNRIKSFFIQPSRMQATIILSIGILLVFTGRPRAGILMEIFGLLNLFGNMFPLLLAMGRNLPVVGDIIKAFEGDSSSRPSGRNRQKRYATEF